MAGKLPQLIGCYWSCDTNPNTCCVICVYQISSPTILVLVVLDKNEFDNFKELSYFSISVVTDSVVFTYKQTQMQPRGQERKFVPTFFVKCNLISSFIFQWHYNTNDIK